jgi:signal transduction histidine kinase
MTTAAALSIVALVVEVMVGVLCLSFASAPGWLHRRRLALLAFTAAAYSLSNVPQTLTVDPSIIVPASQLSLAAAALHLFEWLRYSRSRTGQLFGRLDSLLGGAMLVAAVLAVLPGALARPTVHLHAVPALGLRYATADATPLGSAAFVLFLLAMAVPAARFARSVRERVPGSLPHLGAFAVLIATGVAEALTASRLLSAPYLLDVGILAATLTLGAELVRSVVAGGRALEETAEARGADLARTRVALVQSDGYAALGRLAAGVVHEVNNPLSAIASNASFLREEIATRDGPPRHLGEVLGDISEAAERIRLVVRDLNVLGRGQEGPLAEVELGPVIEGAVRLARHEPGATTRVVVEPSGAPAVLADRARLARALVNLIVHAGHAQQARNAVGPVLLRTRSDGRDVVIELEDSGPSAPTTDSPGPERSAAAAESVGFSVAGSLVQSMGGWVEVEALAGHGSRVTLRLPAAQTVQPARPSRC